MNEPNESVEPVYGVDLRRLAREHGRDLREVVGQLLSDPAAPMLVESRLAKQLEEQWAAEDAADRGRRRNARIIAEGRRLLDEMYARGHDLEVTGQQIERESDLQALAALERRREVDEADYIVAAREWVAFRDAHPEAAAAVESAPGAPARVSAAAGSQFAPLTSLAGYERPNWHEEVLSR